MKRHSRYDANCTSIPALRTKDDRLSAVYSHFANSQLAKFPIRQIPNSPIAISQYFPEHPVDNELFHSSLLMKG
jgi:hypothetical protein